MSWLAKFIIQYWVQWLLGLLVLAIGAVAKHYYSLYKKDKQHTQKDQLDQIHEDMDNKIEKSEMKMAESIVQGQGAIMQQVVNYKSELEARSKERYEYLAGLLTEHEEDAMKSYSSMFNSLTTHLNELKQESDSQDNLIKEDLADTKKEIKVLQTGVLSIQGRDFKDNCRALLKQDHVITEVEYEEISSDHDIYNSLGGNHRGDELFGLVQEKYKKNL